MTWTQYDSLTNDELLRLVEQRDPLIKTDLEVALAKRFEECNPDDAELLMLEELAARGIEDVRQLIANLKEK